MDTEFTTQVLTVPQVPPHSREAEEAVLGSVLIDSEALERLQFLTPEDFYIHRNGWVWQAFNELRRTGQDVDYLTVCEAIERKGRLGEIGGPAYIMGLINRTPSSLNAESYAKIVKERAARRRLVFISEALANAAFNEKLDPSFAVSETIDQLSRISTGNKGAVHWSEFLGKVYDEVQAAVEFTRDIIGISTGFREWDNITGGLVKGTVTRLVGDPGVGKSLLMMQVLTYVAKCGQAVALYELEMAGTQPTRRTLSAQSNIATTALRTGRITPQELEQFVAAFSELAQYPVYMSDDSRMTPAEVRADLVRLKDHVGLEVAAIDYESLLTADAHNENERRNTISDEVHAIAKDLGLAIISVGDVTKESIKGEVQGQGGAAGTAHEIHNADYMLHMKIKTQQGPANPVPIIGVQVTKNREPGTGGNFFELTKVPGKPVFVPVRRTP